MKLTLKPNGWVVFELGPEKKIYRPSNSHLIKVGSEIHVVSPHNDTVQLSLSNVEGELCEPPIDTSNLDTFIVSLQEYFNPNIISTSIDMQPIVDYLSRFETQLDRHEALLIEIRDLLAR